VHAKVTITIPRGALELPALYSVFPGLKQRVGDVFDDVTFGDVTLVGKDVAVDTVTGDKAVVVIHGGQPINGSFTVTERLSIVGGNSPVDVNVTMFSSPHAEKPTVLDIVNNKAPITTTISLQLNSTATANEHNGFFAISQVTKQSDITSNVTSQPLDSIVRFAAVTKDGNVTATFPSAYEGRFSLVASRHGRSLVEADTDVEDPSGEGRKRYLEVKEYFGSIITGFVGWRGGSITEDYFRLKVKDMVEYDGDGDETMEIVDRWERTVVREVPHEGTVHPPSFSEDGEGAESYPPAISLVTSAGTNRLYFV